MKGIEKLKRNYPGIAEDITAKINADESQPIRTTNNVRNMMYRWHKKNLLAKNKKFLVTYINLVLKDYGEERELQISDLE